VGPEDPDAFFGGWSPQGQPTPQGVGGRDYKIKTAAGIKIDRMPLRSHSALLNKNGDSRSAVVFSNRRQ
jgi:hypothetical protein